MGPYWKRVFVEAWRATLANSPWSSLLRVAIAIGTVAGTSGAAYFLSGQNPLAALAGPALGAVAFLAFFLAETAKTPARMDAELRAKLKAEEDADKQRERLRRRGVMDRLVSLYQLQNDSIAPEIIAGFQLPPEQWLNESLAEIGESWQVFDIRGTSYSTFEVVGPAPKPPTSTPQK